MSTIDLDITPKWVVMELRGNTGVFESPLTGNFQTVDRGGLYWYLAYTFNEMRGDDRAELMGIMAALRSQANRLRVQVYDNPRRGSYGGTPLVAGASQTGSSINIDGCSATVTNWIRRGDYFSIDVNGEHELKMATADADTNGSGAITIAFEPRLRASPLDNAAVYVEDLTLPKPQGVFMNAESASQWSSRPGTNGRSTMTLTMQEDVYITQ
jgi:hypothetical protein